MSVESLKEKMREFEAGKIKSVSVSSADLAGHGGGSSDGDGSGPKSGTVSVDVPKEAKEDMFVGAGETDEYHRGMTPDIDNTKIDISDDDRAAFMEALVTGGRYERPFSLYGGRLTGVFRCRKIAESDGIVAWLSHCANTKRMDARVEYMSVMRDAVLAAQVKCLRGIISEDFPELPGPYAPTRSTDGKTVEDPGWLGVAKAWNSRPEALVTAIHIELQKFEKRYWAMVMDAGNQNFWNPAAST